MNAVAELSRTQQLKALTTDTHDQLDKRIMANKPFASEDNYARFLIAQYGFLRDCDPLYDNPDLAALFPDLAERRRYDRIAADISDLKRALPAHDTLPTLAHKQDIPTALGWMYVTEGSKLGAAILLKMAGALGMSETFGARHLAGAPEGRAKNWREFTAVLDGVLLSEEEEARMVAGAKAAFTRMNNHLDQVY
ncbi:biliverdin-producing heme oxygenase [Iodobacter fluviatilis]|uniref:Heme oxygenase n=1 Tax=Iodobacter fluviatilis TaxID=537 RepID=A0A377Q3K4_9NEIS|nr:biliverdin-producing heme oxygenase [Iodobacter fluviatilis]TCU90486.1 heme oxygenase [Iodobacter fluviatilis]STQ89513.1 Heme oxygenase [Iodobacter fluviatilis]